MPVDKSGSRITRSMQVLTRVMSGEELTRHQVAEILSTKLAAADKCLKALAKLPGFSHSNGVLRSDGRYMNIAPPSDLMTLAAAMGLSLARVFEGSEHGVSMRKTLKYILQNARKTIPNAERKFFFVERGGEIALEEAGDVVDDVIQGVRDSRVIEFDYTHVTGQTERVSIRPLTFVVYQHQLYVMTLGGNGPYPYRLSRISNVNLTGVEFSYPSPSAYSPERVFRDSLGIFVSERFDVEEVRIALRGNWARYAQTHRWHKSQLIALEGDRTVVTVRLRVCPEVEAWILAFGEEAEVLSPSALRSRIAKRARAAAEVYGGFPKPGLAGRPRGAREHTPNATAQRPGRKSKRSR
jgi:predicted DNA-binding transcriptional regulator YafY